MANIEIRVEGARGCGFRQPGGIYLVSDGLAAKCGRLPLPCGICPTCHAGIKPSRGWTWVDPATIVGLKEFTSCGADLCSGCPMNGACTRAGLLWIGEKFYPSPEDFNREADVMGVSRRISAVPNDFEVGKTWCLFAHRKAIKEKCTSEMEHTSDCECEGTQIIYQPAIFHAFKPNRIEYVVTGSETDEELDRLESRGFTLIKVVRCNEPLLQGEIAQQVSAAVN